MAWLFGRNKTSSRPLAHCPDRSPGSLRLEPLGISVPVVVLRADGSGVLVETEQIGTPGEMVIGEYRIGDVAFAFQGVVREVLSLRGDLYHWQIRFVIANQ